MKKVLGIIASPRKLGNCEIMVKEIGKNIPEPHELNLLRLYDFNIQACKACYLCLFKKERCILNDDFYTVLNAIEEADALILAVPTYFLGANSSLKVFLDRGLALYAHVDNLWGKPSIGIGIAGIEGKEGSTLLDIERFLKITLSDIKKTAVVYGALPGEIFLNGKNKKTAAELGKILFDPLPEKKETACPLCGGTTFRFLEKNVVQCMLCSNTGIMHIKTKGPAFDINKSGHDFFLSKEEALEHKNWLKLMRGRFIEQKDQLKKITLPYIKGWNWIKP